MTFPIAAARATEASVGVSVAFPIAAARTIIANALTEDLGWGDATTAALVPPEMRSSAIILMKEDGTVAGLPAVAEVFRQVDAAVRVRALTAEGSAASAGRTLATIEGATASILSGERVALNLLQRLSGIATAAARYVEAVAGTRATIVDTRKTTPGLRVLEKYAVRVGGAGNHRMNLSDGILIKDNHLAALRAEGHGLAEAIRRARRAAPHTIRVEIEVTSLDQVREALDGRPDIILLDNMSLGEMREAVAVVAGRALCEASGGIRLDRARSVAETGVDLISVGALTHSTPALDISLEIVNDGRTV
ncbi:MAG: carboxylating nicotinate-nucleotide diphosphorylase [Chloroflexota bacterium]|nr:MAG: carboxylating nicotinate-nucleotide diphosphorylase [Chloroflexota bacterium]